VTGAVIQHYRLGDILGSGGMGTVYRAEDLRLGRSVAVKLLHQSEGDAELRARLVREARAASSLRSSGIASIYDIGEHEGAPFIVMELVEGESLAARLARGPLPAAEAVDVAMQVADALDEAHRRGVVHRDIKSANIMLDERSRVKVLDFGLAKFLEPGTGGKDETIARSLQTVAGSILGTFAYMSPEQALGRPADARADLFSLGVVLYELLTGRLPFDGPSAVAILDATLHQQPLPPTRLAPGLPPILDAIVLKALAKDAAYRYQSARELYIDLRNVVLDLSSHRSVVPGSGATGASTHWSGTLPPGGAPGARTGECAVAVLSFSNITGEPADEWIGQGIAETLTTDLKNVRGLQVIGRAQLFDVLRAMGAAAPGATGHDRLSIEVGRRVGASAVVAGGYQRSGPLLRITAQLVDVDTGRIERTVKMDGRVEEIFDLQDRLVYELSEGLRLRLNDSEIEAIAQDETSSLEAYETFSRGLLNLRTASPDAVDLAIAQFEQALALDPNYANAWASLGNALHTKGMFLAMPDLTFKGIDALRRAIALDPRLSQAHYQLGNAYTNIGHHEEAIASIREALRLDPSNAGAHSALGRAYWYGNGQFDEGIVELEHAVRLNPEAGYAWLQLSLLYSLTGRSEEGEQAARRAVELQERTVSGTEGLQVVGAHSRLGYALYRQGRFDEAIEAFERELAFLASSDHALRQRMTIEVQQKLGAAYFRKGNRVEADRHFERARTAFNERLARGADDPATRYYVAALHALRGDAAAARLHLRVAVARLKPLNVARVRLDPDFDPIREDPAFAALVAAA
jgi:serine/threonine protein kinase/tetratricopeptide (TPR) repeat protein